MTTDPLRLPYMPRPPFRLFCGRSATEVRTGESPYDLLYQYDAGGNRTLKLDDLSHQQVEYHYDVEPGASPAIYGSRANRLMWYETWNTTIPTFPQLVSTTYYVYTYDSTDARVNRSDGNPTRIISEYPVGFGQEESAMGEGQSSTLSTGDGQSSGSSTGEGQSSTLSTDSDGQSAASSSPMDDGGESLMGPGGGGGCGTGKRYTAIRLGYAVNGRTVTYAHDESWCWDGVQACPTNYAKTWALEFRYDGARARYMNRPLNPTTLAPHLTKPTVWTDYDGAETYRDYTVSAGAVVLGDAIQPGLWRNVTGVSAYLHNDHLGTLRNTSDIGADPGLPRVFTAFGERVGGPTDRHGYVGAHGYQSHPEEPELPFLHVGARNYDPSSGRFLQRDPIGIRGGLNVYAYVRNTPTWGIDPNGTAPDYGGSRGGVPPPTPERQREIDRMVREIVERAERSRRGIDSIEDMEQQLENERLLQNTVNWGLTAVGGWAAWATKSIIGYALCTANAAKNLASE